MTMHKMQDTPRILTIVGLVVEGLAILVFASATVILRTIANIPKDDLINDGWSDLDAQILLNFTRSFSIVTLIIGILIFVMFLINLVLFTKLIKGMYDEKQAKHIYMYQAIWGGVCILFNTITGVLYLISAVQSQSKYRPTRAREGL